MELSPKLEALTSILNDILTCTQKSSKQSTVLILTSREGTADMIQHYLSEGKSRLADWLVRGRMEYEHPPDPPPSTGSDKEEESSPTRNSGPSFSREHSRGGTSRRGHALRVSSVVATSACVHYAEMNAYKQLIVLFLCLDFASLSFYHVCTNSVPSLQNVAQIISKTQLRYDVSFSRNTGLLISSKHALTGFVIRYIGQRLSLV